MNLFGKKKTAAAPVVGSPAAAAAAQDTMKAIMTQKSDLEKKIQQNEKRAAMLREQAKARAKAGDKRGAAQLLKQKLMYDKQMDTHYTMLSNLQALAFAAENQNTNAAFVNTISTAAKQMKQQASAMGADKIDDVMDEVEDVLGMQQEVQDALSREFSSTAGLDAEDELAALEAELAAEAAVEPIAVAATGAGAAAAAPVVAAGGAGAPLPVFPAAPVGLGVAAAGAAAAGASDMDRELAALEGL